jgi:5-methylcytosine-specific restriction endonuclease McrA
MDETSIEFENLEDRSYFENLILLNNDFINKDTFEKMFDFRNPVIKRKEFNKVRAERLETLKLSYGLNCMLKLDCCDENSGHAVDHIIPLSTNKLNKEIRNVKPLLGKKVVAQSFGSNNIENLVIACNKCNNHKKHRILSRNKLITIIKEKSSS